jgi:hypothetical protein
MSSESLSFPGMIHRNNAYQPPMSFKDMLHGEKAFYDQPDYLKSTRKDLCQKRLPVTYTWNTESKYRRIAKQILSIVVFPIGVYKLLHSLAGKAAILPSSNPSLMGYPKNHAAKSRRNICVYGDWKYKRITIAVDGYKIDAMIVGKASTLNNGRWVLASNGNSGYYEDKLSNSYDFKQVLSKVNGNAIVFNYPGVAASSGIPNRKGMEKAYRAMLAFLEDKKQGIGAQEIIGYGHSIGGGAQGDALGKHELKKDIKYVFVKKQTFSNLQQAVSNLMARPMGFLVKIMGWNIDSTASSKKLKVPEIIMQTAKVKDYEELKDSTKIIDDGVIYAKGSLAKNLLDDQSCPKENKTFIGMSERHNDPLEDPTFLAEKIEASLKRA